jgi:hypothetical protein
MVGHRYEKGDGKLVWLDGVAACLGVWVIETLADYFEGAGYGARFADKLTLCAPAAVHHFYYGDNITL